MHISVDDVHHPGQAHAIGPCPWVPRLTGPVGSQPPFIYSEAMASDVISFARGAPSADILPAQAVREAAARALESDWQKALSYGTGFGHPGLCEWVATELHGIDTEQVM